MVDVWLHARLQAPIGLLGVRGGTPYPATGAWQDQPAALMDAFALLDRMVEQKDETDE